MKNENKKWSNEEIEYLMESWGNTSWKGIAKKLNRSVPAIMDKARALGLGSFLENGEYITVQLLLRTLGYKGSLTRLIRKLEARGFPVYKKCIYKTSVKVVNLNDFWSWLENNKASLTLARLKPLELGEEPNWVKFKRELDLKYEEMSYREWTNEDDHTLNNLLKMQKYTHTDLSKKLNRTEVSLENRIRYLCCLDRPIKQKPRKWNDKEIEVLLNMYYEGYPLAIMNQYLDRSELAIKGKLDQMIKLKQIKAR